MDRKKGKWGSDLIRTRISREPYWLEKRTWKDLKFFEWIFILVAISSILISIGFSTYQLVTALTDNEEKKYYIFPVLIIINNLFSVFFLWHGVREEMPFRLLAQLAIKAIIWLLDLIYFVTPYWDEKPERMDPAGSDEDDLAKQIREIRFYVSSAMVFLTITSGGFVIYQYWTSNIAIFRAVGTEPKYVRLYRMWSLSHNMILLDAVVFVMVLFHLCNFPYFIDSYAAYYLLPVWLIATMAYVFLGIAAVDRESRMMTYGFYVASHFQPIFVIFMLVKASRKDPGLLLYISLYSSAVLNLITHIGLLIAVVRCQNSYGMGLKQAAAKEVERKNLLTNETGSFKDNVKGDERYEQPPPAETEL